MILKLRRRNEDLSGVTQFDRQYFNLTEILGFALQYMLHDSFKEDISDLSR